MVFARALLLTTALSTLCCSSSYKTAQSQTRNMDVQLHGFIDLDTHYSLVETDSEQITPCHASGIRAVQLALTRWSSQACTSPKYRWQKRPCGYIKEYGADALLCRARTGNNGGKDYAMFGDIAGVWMSSSHGCYTGEDLEDIAKEACMKNSSSSSGSSRGRSAGGNSDSTVASDRSQPSGDEEYTTEDFQRDLKAKMAEFNKMDCPAVKKALRRMQMKNHPDRWSKNTKAMSASERASYIASKSRATRQFLLANEIWDKNFKVASAAPC